MKKLLGTISIVAALGAGAFAISTVLPAGAQSPGTTPPASDGTCAAPGRGKVVQGALDGLVQKGVINQDQANAVIQALKDAAKNARAANGADNGMRAPKLKLFGGMVKVAADKIGVAPKDLVAARRNGQSVADVATSKGVDPKDVVTAIVDAGNKKIDDAVSSGHMQQPRADQAKAKLPQLADRFVNAKGAAGCGPQGGAAPGSDSSDSTSSSDQSTSSSS